MALTTRKGLLNFSPIRKDDANKENDVPVLTLIQFSKAPFVTFGTVKIGTSKSAVLRIDNPTVDAEAEVIIEKLASNRGFSVDHNTFTIQPEGSFSLTITWTPTEDGGVRELIIFNANGVLKHQAVLLGRAEAPKKKKKTLWDSIKNRTGAEKVSAARAKNANPAMKMSTNKTFQVSRKPEYKRGKPRSPLASLNVAKSSRERSLSRKSPADDPQKPEDKQQGFATSAAQENINVFQKNSLYRVSNGRDYLSLPENKDLTKVLNRTLSPVGTPDTLKKRMPRIESFEHPAAQMACNATFDNLAIRQLDDSPILSLKDALAIIDSDLSPINSSPQESSCEFSDSLDSKSGNQDKHFLKVTSDSREIDGPRMTFFVGKNDVQEIDKRVEKVKWFTSTTVTKGKAQAEEKASTGRKIKKSRRRLLEKTLALTDSGQSDSRPGTPCLPIIDADTGLKEKSEDQELSLIEPTARLDGSSPAPITLLVTYPTSADTRFAFTGRSSPVRPAAFEFTVASPPTASSVHCGLPSKDMLPSVFQSPPVLATSPEPFPVYLAVNSKKRKSDEFLKAGPKVKGAGKTEQQVKRRRVATVKSEPDRAMHRKRQTSQRPQPRPAGSVSNVSLKALRSVAPAQVKQHVGKPTTCSTPSVKSSAQKKKVVAVAQSTLSFVKSAQTAIPRHPMPFAAKNMFFDERWIEKQERGFTWWLNYVLTPDDFKVNTEVTKVNAVSLAMGSNVNVPKAPTKEEMSFSTYTARRKLNRLRRSACQLFTSEAMVKAIQRLELEVEAKRLLVRKDRHLWKDIGERQKVLNWLLSYNPLWLRIGLETIYGELISLENNGDTFGLALFILQRLLWNPDMAAEFRHPNVPHLYRDGHEEALSRFTLKKLLLLVCFLDKAKASRLIEHDPCLFCMDAEFKTSKDLLLAFSRDFLSGEGILPRHLGYLGLPVSHEQKPLDEFNFAVKNVAVDLKCGIRLVRVMELLVQDWSLSPKLRLPAISRLQKVHNVDVTLQVLKSKGVDLKDEHGSVIDSRDIVDGHREKTLGLLWKIIFAFHVELNLNEDQLKEEISFLRKALKTKRRLAHLRADCGPQPRPAKDKALFEDSSPKIRLLMDWVCAVCDFYNLKVQNFTVSFSDGRALCYLIHHYHPSLLPEQSVSQNTTQTVESSLRGRLELDFSSSDNSCDFSPSGSSETPSLQFKELLENERHNFRLINSAVAFLGGVPSMINAANMSNTIPNEKVVISYVSFLCTRLLDLRNETRAARVIQAAWRKYRLEKDERLYQERNEAALRIQSLVRKFLQRRRAERQRLAAVFIQAVWRGYVARRKLRLQKEAQLRLQRLNAAVIIQAQWRMFSAIKSYKSLRYSAIVIQAQWRMKRAAAAFERILWAVTVIQTRTRAWAIAKKERECYLCIRTAAVQIQRGYRQWKSRKTRNENCAAQVIQAAFRKWYKRKMSERVVAAVRIQSWYRMLMCLSHYRKIKRSAVLIQAQYRGYAERRSYQMLKLQQQSAVVLQSAFRGYAVRKQVAKMTWAAVIIQQHFRATVKRNTERQLFLRKKHAAIMLQAAYRGKLSRGLLIKQHKAATVIQSAFRKCIGQRRYLLMRNAAILIQQKYRATSLARKTKKDFVALKNAVVRIQAVWRGRLDRKRLEKQTQSATIIQTWFRQHVAQERYKSTKAAALVIQQYFRAYMAGRKVRDTFLSTRAATVSLQAAFRGMKVRRELKKRHEAAVVLQSYVRMMLLQKRYSLLQSAAIIIQSRYRAVKACQEQQEEYRQLKQATLKIQAVYRGLVVRRARKRQHNAATAIQAHFRMHRMRLTYLAAKCAAVMIQDRYRAKRMRDQQVQKFRIMKSAVVTIQAAYRSYKARKQIQQMHSAATIIQRAFFTYRARNEFITFKKAALVCQRWYRSAVMARGERCEYLSKRRAVVCLQSAYRGCQVRRHLRKEHQAATIIQSHFRKHQLQTRYKKLLWAAKVLQARFRANCKRRMEMQALKVRRNAAIVLQAAFRGMRSRRLLKERNRAALVIQRAFRAYCQHKQYLALKLAAIMIQQRYRASAAARKQRRQFLQMRSAVMILQAAYRGHQVRKEVARWHQAATVIQSSFRKHREEVKYQAMRLSAIVIQRYYRSSLLQRQERANFVKVRHSVIVLQAAFRGQRVRKNISRRNRAATVIQANFRRHKQQSTFKTQRWAACVLQQRYRAQRQKNLDMQRYQQQKTAAIVLQAAYRGMKSRQNIRRINQAACIIQRLYRAHRQHKQYVALKQSALTFQRRYRATAAAKEQMKRYQQMQKAAVVFQAAFRGHRVRKEVVRSHKAATVIQSAFRRHREEVKYQAMQRSAIFIQRYYRSWLLQRQQRDMFLKVKWSTIFLQAVLRGWQVRKDTARQKQAAVSIQSCWRCFVQRRHFQRKREAALKLQRWVRAVQLGQLQRDNYNKQRRAAVILQTHWRAWITKTQALEAAKAERRLRFTAAIFHHLNAIKIQRALRIHWALLSAKKQIYSVITIQCWVRTWIQKRRYQEDKRKVVIAQRAVRRWFNHRQRAACVIQQAVRKFLFVRRQKRVQLCIVRFQALWRGYRFRQQNDNPKVVKLRQRLRKVSASVREEDKLCNKTASALDYLLRYKHFSDILEALKNLETATRLSPECCERLVESGATNVIFTLIRCCNRSVPCMDIITFSIQILLNLSKYHKTIEAVYSVESSVETLLDLLQRYREKAGDKVAEKGGSIFTKACFLLALLLQDKPRAVDVMKIPRALDRIKSIYCLTARKHKMDAQRTVVKQKMNASINGSFLIQATPRKARPTSKFAPDWVLQKDKLKDIVDPLKAIQMVAETLSIAL